MAEPQKGRKTRTGRHQTGTSLLRIYRLAIMQFSSRRWLRVTALVLAIPAGALSFAATYYYVSFAGLIDARLHGARQRVLPKVFARPLELRQGQSLTSPQLVDQLN